MKIAEMRPPLIEISINQPKVLALSKDKKGTRQAHTHTTNLNLWHLARI